ncbi:hypothetical protein [Desulfobacterium sp. N47]|uniref:Uncharacterized protein n=1 Tax=uncultured Desulfobacterium sp. TaxID=201089 RepID=E1YGC8_9BACT|nr:unknown protein [uncultured Desulfobacterium sp.]
MAISGKYGKIDIPGIGADEPVFIIRAQDRLAVPAIEMYCALTFPVPRHSGQSVLFSIFLSSIKKKR